MLLELVSLSAYCVPGPLLTPDGLSHMFLRKEIHQRAHTGCCVFQAICFFSLFPIDYITLQWKEMQRAQLLKVIKTDKMLCNF